MPPTIYTLVSLGPWRYAATPSSSSVAGARESKVHQALLLNAQPWISGTRYVSGFVFAFFKVLPCPVIVDVSFVSPIQNFDGEPRKRCQVHRSSTGERDP